MAQLNLRVGASVDRNMQVAFQPLVEGAKRAKAAIDAEGKKSAAAISTNVKRGTKDAEARFRELENEIKTGMPRAMNAGSAAVAKFGKEASTSFAATKRAFGEMAKDAEKQLGRVAKAQKEAATPQNFGGAVRGLAKSGWKAAGGTESIGSGIAMAGGMAIGLAKKAAFAAAGIVKDLAKAAGVDTDIGTIAKKNYDLEATATNVANAGLIAGDKNNGQRVRGAELSAQALDVGAKTGTDANTLMSGLDKFTGKTGDLKTGRDIMETMAVYSKATGSSMEDMMDAAGDVSNQLGDVENKSQAVKDLMRTFAGQGKLGAVEIKNLATQMAKIGAAAVRFEGTRTQSITQMGVLAQMARARGGAFSAANAATAVGAFAGVFSKGARLNAFEKMGVNVQGEGNKVKTVRQLIVESMVASEKKAGLGMGFDKAMGSMFADTSSRKATSGWEAMFKEAGGGAEGVKRVNEEFDRLEKAIIADEEIQASFAEAMKGSQSQAEVFNNQIRKSAMQMQTDLQPALMGLAAALVPAVKELANWVTFMTGDKQATTISGIATDDVNAAVKSTEKMTAGGKISDVQIESNRIAGNEARESKARAAAELKNAKDTLAEKQKAGDYSFWTNPLFANKADDANSFLGRTLGANEEGDKKNIVEKEEALKRANDVLEKITQNNDEVKRKLDGKLIVVIDNVDAFKNAAAPPAAGTDGRQPPPEAAPR